MNTSTLDAIKEILTKIKATIEKAKLPFGYEEWQRESQIMLTEVLISECDREVESNRKRSERTKKCMSKKMSKFDDAKCLN